MMTKFSTKSASYLFILFAALTALTTSCSKENEKVKEDEEQIEGGINSISFKADGVQKNIDSDGSFRIANFATTDDLYQAAFTAENEKFGIDFIINDIKPISKKEYPDNYAYMTAPDPAHSKVTYFDYVNKLNYKSKTTGSNNWLTTVTKIGPDVIGGTFEGKIYTPDGKAYVTITDGKFNIKMSPIGTFLR